MRSSVRHQKEWVKGALFLGEALAHDCWMLSGVFEMRHAALFDGPFFDLSPFLEDALSSAKIDIA